MKNNLSLTLQQLDSNDTALARKVFTISDTTPTVGEWRSGVLIDTSQTTISLPLTQPRQVLFHNTHATAKITVVWTPFGGSEVTVSKLGPGGGIALWDPTAAGSLIGISTLKLTSDTINGTYELFIGG